MCCYPFIEDMEAAIGAIEPCIYAVDATKTKPAGFRVQKFVTHLDGTQHNLTKIFRPVDDSDDERQFALEQARQFVKQLEREKMTGEIYRRIGMPEKPQEPQARGIPWHEYSDAEKAKINRDLQDDYERWKATESDPADTPLSEWIEGHLSWYEDNTSRSNFNKISAAYQAVEEYCEATSSELVENSIEDIQPSEIDRLFSWMAQQTRGDSEKPRWSKSSLKGYFTKIRSILRAFAADENARNPADTDLLKTDIGRIAKDRSRRKVLTDDEVQQLEKGIEKAIETSQARWRHLRIYIRYLHRVLLGTGMRIGEALYLKTEHIDFDQKTLTIEGSVTQGEVGPTKRGAMLGDPESGIRVIPMTEDVADALRQWLDKREDLGFPSASDCTTIFCQKTGKYATAKQIRKRYARACRASEMNIKVTPHMIRHTCNDRMRRAGVPIEIRQVLLAHADAETNKRYTDVDPLEARAYLNGSSSQ